MFSFLLCLLTRWLFFFSLFSFNLDLDNVSCINYCREKIKAAFAPYCVKWSFCDDGQTKNSYWSHWLLSLCSEKPDHSYSIYASDILFQSFRGYFNRQIIFAFLPAQRGIESKRDDRVNCIKAFCQPEYVPKFSTHWHTEKCTKSAKWV